jgi:hypothetical protein
VNEVVAFPFQATVVRTYFAGEVDYVVDVDLSAMLPGD